MKISRRHGERRCVRSLTVTEGAMTSEAMGLIENFSFKWIIHEALRCRVADEHEKNGQEGEASDTQPLPILQECSVGEETGHLQVRGC